MRLLFVSPRFLFPADEGGKIRTGQILRGMRGGAFEITLLSPAPADVGRWSDEIGGLCDRFVSWPERVRGPLHKLLRLAHLAGKLPVPVATDRDAEGARLVADELARGPAVVVFDFVHAAVLAPDPIGVPSVMFTHNVETAILDRQVAVAGGLQRAVWRNQARKMADFERSTLRRFDEVVAVSEKDATWFRERLELPSVTAISTGVDLDFFPHQAPTTSDHVVFTGALDWHANVEGIGWLLDAIWPLVRAQRPSARLTVVGRNPPEELVERGRPVGVEFTGFVDDIRPHCAGAAAYVIPLRVGGGTRIKAYEAMAMGPPVVSTTIGVEGLPIEPGEHYLRADEPQVFADALCGLLEDATAREALSRRARAFVEERCSYVHAAREFEAVCRRAAESGTG